jgi:hypothetical protein
VQRLLHSRHALLLLRVRIVRLPERVVPQQGLVFDGVHLKAGQPCGRLATLRCKPPHAFAAIAAAIVAAIAAAIAAESAIGNTAAAAAARAEGVVARHVQDRPSLQRGFENKNTAAGGA